MLLGIDTGGTYTDAVLLDESPSSADPIRATAKARTRPDLTIGIRDALAAIDPDPAVVSLVSLSTTLATNALVEGIGGHVALVLVGFTEAEAGRAGLAETLGYDPLLLIDGGHDSFGAEAAPIDLDRLRALIDDLEVHVDAFAVAGQFSVRNPAHEHAVRDLLIERTGRPVACSHELSARLNGPRRALTCLLNARLLGLLQELCRATERILAEFGIRAPLMLVRGDGSLVSAEFALARPIETILSGPAASLVGAEYLLRGRDRTDADTGVMVSDIGGTTTDIGVIEHGRPAVSSDGAVVGGHHTMVEAVRMFTTGLGGDSELHVDRSPPPRLVLGPRRLTPISLAAQDDPDAVHRVLDGRREPYRETDTRFIRATGRQGTVSARDRRLLDKLDRADGGWLPVDSVVSSSIENTALTSLVRRGLAQAAGFTPSDAAHVLQLHTAWDGKAAAKAAAINAAITDNRGQPLRPDGESLARWVLDTLVRQSAEAVLSAGYLLDGLPADGVDHALIQRALDERSAESMPVGSLTRTQTRLSLPLVALGASAPVYYPGTGHYPGVAQLLDAHCVVPEHAAVANAIGAVVGQVRLTARCTIGQPSKGQYRIHWPGLTDRGDLQPAIDDAVAALGAHVTDQALVAGAAEVVLTDQVEIRTAMMEGREVFVEAEVEVTATGRPRLGGAGSTD
jgi:N-methylhydantoinase A/oxoprolinase/acetone carboxylase beta subunit